MIFGLLGAALLVVDGLLRAVGGVVALAIGHPARAVGAWEGSVLFLVVGFLVAFFALIGRAGTGERGVASGVVLVVLAVVGWLLLGLGGGLLGVIGSLFVLIGGVLFLAAAR